MEERWTLRSNSRPHNQPASSASTAPAARSQNRAKIVEKANFSLNNYADTFMVAAATLPGNVVSALLMDRIGARSVGAWAMGMSAAMAPLFALNTSSAVLVATTACLFNGISVAGWNALTIPCL